MRVRCVLAVGAGLLALAHSGRADSAVDAGDAAGAANGLGLDVLKRTAAALPDGNILISPTSLEQGMALVYAGASGRTRSEMARVLGLPDGEARATAMLDAMHEELTASAVRTAGGPPGTAIEIHEANRIFGQRAYPWRQSFLDELDQAYGAPMVMEDFLGNPEASADAINAWVEGRTQHRIQGLVPPSTVGRDTRLVLANALYFKAPWDVPFVERKAETILFRVGGSDLEDVPMMARTARLGYVSEVGYTAVALPYEGGEFQFLILLPDDPNGVDDLLAHLTAALLRRYAVLGRDVETSTRVDLTLPKFHIEPSPMALSSALRALGLATIFDGAPGRADFSRAALPPRTPGEGPLHLSEVFHKTFIALDENGTEAAAATGEIAVATTMVREETEAVEVRVDHPFIFAIQHRESGACLFLGRVTDPR